MLVTGGAQHATEKMPRVVMRMKSDQAGTEESVDQFAPPVSGQHAEQLEGGKGNVKEKADSDIWKAVPQQFRQEHEFVVMHPHDIAWPQFLGELVGEEAVYLAVLLPAVFVVFGERGEIVKKRPDSFVAEAVVKLLHALCRKKQG